MHRWVTEEEGGSPAGQAVASVHAGGGIGARSHGAELLVDVLPQHHVRPVASFQFDACEVRRVHERTLQNRVGEVRSLEITLLEIGQAQVCALERGALGETGEERNARQVRTVEFGLLQHRLGVVVIAQILIGQIQTRQWSRGVALASNHCARVQRSTQQRCTGDARGQEGSHATATSSMQLVRTSFRRTLPVYTNRTKRIVCPTALRWVSPVRDHSLSYAEARPCATSNAKPSIGQAEERRGGFQQAFASKARERRWQISDLDIACVNTFSAGIRDSFDFPRPPMIRPGPSPPSPSLPSPHSR
mmetsp:Transcript_7576/g.46604  ORF Transcript_7576/g.46604 Transcript_7576/m.46604 type:complete len:304 (+) Transcript_7576:182-1093(+)